MKSGRSREEINKNNLLDVQDYKRYINFLNTFSKDIKSYFVLFKHFRTFLNVLATDTI